jgi:hypothetical protein
MKVLSLFALIGLLMVFGISEILLSKILLEILSKPLVIFILSSINFLAILIVIRMQPYEKPVRASSESVTPQSIGKVLET